MVENVSGNKWNPLKTFIVIERKYIHICYKKCGKKYLEIIIQYIG